jgi:6-phosphogluconolactonase
MGGIQISDFGSGFWFSISVLGNSDEGAAMKYPRWARQAFLSSSLLFLSVCVLSMAGCGDFWQAPSSTTTSTSSSCTTDCTTASSGNFYILNASATAASQIEGFAIANGALTAISGSPWTLAGTGYSMAVAPNGDFLMVATTSGVFAYPLTSGALGTAVQVTTDQAFGVQVDATNTWLLEAIPGTGGLSIGAVPINSLTGAGNGTEQTASFTVTNASVQPNQMVISGDNDHIFVALGAGGTIVDTFNSTVSSGSNPLGSKASTIPVLTSGGTALSVGVDAGTAPGLFYIGETLASAGTTGGLRVFNYSSLASSTLTQVANSPFASGGLAPNFILPATQGGYVYVANGEGTTAAGNISGFTITSTGTTTLTYSVTTGASIATGVDPLSMAEDSTGTFVFEVGSLGSPFFDSYTFDTTTLGQLDSQLSSATSTGSIAIVATP